MEFYLNSTDLRGCINRLENVEITLKIISTSITDISQNMGNVGLGEVLPNIFLISETLKAHSAKVKCFGDSMLNIVNRYVRAEESIQGDTVLLGQLIDDYAATFGQPDMKLNNSENNPMNQYVEDMLRELGYTNEEIEYIMNDLSQYIGSLYATSHWSTVDLPKILATINELLARRGSGDFTYTINGEVYTISEEEIQILKDAEQGSYGLDYMGYGVYNDQGELIGILPHYVNDGGVTLGYGHYISPGECAADQSEAALIAQYVGENTPLDVSGYGAVPGAEMVPIDVCNELLYNDVQEHLTPIVNFLNEENIQVTENELWALVLYRYNCGHLSNDIMELLREGNRDEAAWSVAWGGASGDRQELCQSISLIKLVYIIFGAMCFFGCLLCGCAKKHEDVQSETSVEAPANMVSNSQELNNYEEQLDILLEKKDVWKLNESYSGDFCEAVDLANSSGFAIADLDEDGYLEIIKSGYSGSGHYSINYIYEITEDRDLIEWNMSEMEKYDSQPDFYFLDNISKNVDDAGNYYYIVEDLIKDGTSLSINRYFSMSIESNRINLEMLGYIENKEGNVRYYLENDEVPEQVWVEWENSIMRFCDMSFDLLWFNVNVNIKMFKKWKIKMYILFHSVFRLAVKKCSLFLKPV